MIVDLKLAGGGLSESSKSELLLGNGKLYHSGIIFSVTVPKQT